MKGDAKGLLIIAGKPKGKSAGEGPSPGGSEDMYFEDAFNAVQDGDPEAFATAMRKAVKMCIAKGEDY